ncbi:MAG: hypothetical protein GY769_03485 [bacterium]|nr:hypothetical protein [bacterium]
MAACSIAYFVTPHGFGHAARAAAVMAALGRRESDISFEIVTTVPTWFFAQSLSVQHRVLPVECDVGLVQIDPVREDARATVTALERFWFGLDEAAESLARGWSESPPRVVVSDISPLGVEVARRLGVPSVLVENFTWDWIYDAYLDSAPRLLEFAERCAELSDTATLHIQCEPVCQPLGAATRVGPVSRTARAGRTETRRAVGLEDTDQRPLVFLTMGGMGWGSVAPEPGNESFFVTLGGVDRLCRDNGILRLPNRSPVYPPDLIWAADAVIAKLGYSTVAECFHAGARLGYIGRASFPESPVLEEFVRRNLPSIELPPNRLEESDWRRDIERLLVLSTGSERRNNGADQIADLLLALMSDR